MDEKALYRYLVDNLSLQLDVNQYDTVAHLTIKLRLRNKDYPSGHPMEFTVIDTVRDALVIPTLE